MSDPIVLTYPQSDVAFIAASQNVATNASFVLKGSTPYVPMTTGPVWLNQMQRYISITSSDNMSAVNFTVTGYALGLQDPSTIITDTIAGPTAAATVQTAKQFQTVLSVVPDDDATNTSIGIGNGATFEWKTMDYFRPYAQYSYQGVIKAGGNISYSVLQTLNKIQNPPSSITGFPNNNSVMTPYTDDVFYSFSYPVSGLQLVVNAEDTDDTGALTFTILQQGLR